MSALTPELLSDVARRYGTPVYVYDAAIVRRQLDTLGRSIVQRLDELLALEA